MSDNSVQAIMALSEAFRSRDIAAAMACFVDDAGTIYIGSERNEIAVGPDAVRDLLEGVFARDEAYSWKVERMWSSAVGDLHTVVAELAGTVHFDSGGTDCFPYRMSGVLRIGDDADRWLLCHGAEPTTTTSVPAVEVRP